MGWSGTILPQHSLSALCLLHNTRKLSEQNCLRHCSKYMGACLVAHSAIALAEWTKLSTIVLSFTDHALQVHASVISICVMTVSRTMCGEVHKSLCRQPSGGATG